MKPEIFRPVKLKYFEHYEISNYGILYNTLIDRIIFGHDINGKLAFQLCNYNITKKIYVHRLVLMHFKKSEIGKKIGIHKDFNKYNNDIDNLNWSDYSNQFRRYRVYTGRLRGVYPYPYGLKKWRALLCTTKGKHKIIGYYSTKFEALTEYYFAYLKEYKVPPFDIKLIHDEEEKIYV